MRSGSAKRRLDAQDVEEISRYQEALHTFRIACRASQTCPAPAVETQALEDAILSFPIQVVRRRDMVPVTSLLFVLLERHGETVDFRQGDRFPEQRIGDAEYSGRSSDSQCQSQSGDHREARILPQHPQRVA